MWKVYLLSFFGVAFFYALLAATTTIFYRNKYPENLSHNERNILYKRATIIDRLSMFFGNLVTSIFAPPVYILAGIITFIIWLIF